MSTFKVYQPFPLNFFHVSISDWREKKKQLMSLVDWNDPQCQFPDHYTDYHKHIHAKGGRPPYTEKFISIFQKELVEFANKNAADITITALWAQKYTHMQNMEPHTHGSHGYSAVLYADFYGAPQEATIFWAPFKDPLSSLDHTHCPKVKQGDLILFPSSLIHWARPNTSDKPRTIFSFNLQFQKRN